MSHFSVAVLSSKNGKSLEELLAPYQENNMGDCPKEFLKFCKNEDYEETEIEAEYIEYKDEYKNKDDFMFEEYGLEKNKKTGEYGRWENPNAQWDWYTVGGRWENILLTKTGEKVNSAMLKDIDWDTIKLNLVKEAKEAWNNSNSNQLLKYFNGIKNDDTIETFIKRKSDFSTYAVITPDGEWYSRGKMGWFGISSETREEAEKWDLSFYDKFIKDSDEDLELTIVDCHI